MRKFLAGLLILILPVVLFLNSGIRNYVAYKLSFSVCDKPISYRIDTVDPRFSLSREEFIQDVTQAESIWETASEKNLFVYNPEGELSINLIFDERQYLTNQINKLEGEVQTNKEKLTPQIQEYEKLRSDFESKLESFKKEVAEWNSRGGAPEDVYNRLTEEQRNLQSEAQRLNELAKNLNLSTQNINSQVAQLNQTIRVFNDDLAERPEEGIYKGAENRIEIYFNISEQELVHTIAHELGHALGLGHVNSPKSMMYYKTNQIITLSTDDQQAMEYLCRRRSVFEMLKILIQRLKVINLQADS